MINDYIKIKDVDKETIEKYSGKLPDEYLDIWQEHGYCTFYNGYLKIIDPEDYQELLEKSFFLGNVSIPIMATAL
ncbi:GAD-like domain-containing protein [Ruminococcus sp.]|uniref:GAD-like domain-containing protein n=1 Tax=Ruminococcus sp. TaxID=41978 RepID=UPI0025E176AA|nr:GAD-like domain-containing protein [Ruminococcus sp.]